MSYGLLVIAALFAISSVKPDVDGDYRIGFMALTIVLSALAMVAAYNNY